MRWEVLQKQSVSVPTIVPNRLIELVKPAHKFDWRNCQRGSFDDS